MTGSGARILSWLRWFAPWIAVGLGALQSLAFAPVSIAPLGILCMMALWWLWEGVSAPRAAVIGFAFGLGLFLAGTYWIYTSVHGFGQAPAALAIVLMLGLVSIMGAYTAGLGWLVGRFTSEAPLVRELVALPAAWVLMEWFRGWFLSGFPWLAVGYSQIDMPLAGFAPVLGVYGVSLAATLSVGLLLALARGPGRVRVVAALAFAILWAAGFALEHVEWTQPVGEPVSVALVQGAIPQDLKWQESNRDHTLEVYRDMTEQAFGSRLIVWPESALPILYHEAVPFLAPIYSKAQAHGSDLLLGLIRYDVDAQGFRNGLVALGQAEEWYYKRRLVPFGEFFPVPGFVRAWMRLRNLTYVDFAAGASSQGVLHAGGQALAATICYEDAYAAEQLAGLNDATLLVNVSNDAWFGDSTAPHQHLQITRMRALEAGRWMLRATNNGISALIDPHGRVNVRSRQFVPEVLRGMVVPYRGLTPYARGGNWPILGICGVLVALAAGLRLRHMLSVSQSRSL
jgi:apolipoprotein N-acyltransferase